MALITCPECNGRVSDKATTCPHCGYPIALAGTPGNGSVSTVSNSEKFWIERIKGGWVYFHCSCGKTVDKPYAIVTQNNESSYTLNETLVCPFCKAEEKMGAEICKPSVNASTTTPRYTESGVCPCCGRANIQAVKKGFGLGKAAVGGLLLGPVGLLGGAIGANDIQFVCLSCGHKWGK